MIQLLRLLALYGVYLVVLSSCETSMLFPGAGREPRARRDQLPANESRALHQVGNGASAESWLVLADDRTPTPPLLVLGHGNGEMLDDHLPHARTMARSGVDVLLIGFPGYAAGEGTPTAKGIRDAAGLAYDWAVRDKLNSQPPRIVGFGFSMGTGLICALAGDREVDALVLCAPFDSLSALAWRMKVPGFLLRNRIDNVKALDGYAGPVKILHGAGDSIIRPEHSEKLAASLSDVERVVVDGVHHNDLFASPVSVETVDGWLALLLRGESPAPTE